MIAEFLDLEQNLKRRFREDSITDILIASLLSLPGNDVVVTTPIEARTGSDFDLVIVDPVNRNAVQFRIQAKRLTPNAHDWTVGSYAELAYPRNTGLQSKTLVGGLGREAILTIPLYAFYNPARVCAASRGVISGIELANGWDVRERVKVAVKAKPQRLPYKRIGSLQSLFFPLEKLLCPPRGQIGEVMIPLPAEVLESVRQAVDERSAFVGSGRASGITTEMKPGRLSISRRTSGLLGQPPHARHDGLPSFPALIRAAIDRREERIIRAKVKRPRVLLISKDRES